MSHIGRALRRLENAKHALRNHPAPLTAQDQALAWLSVGNAIRELRRVDPEDVVQWIDVECCAECGDSDVAIEGDDGAPYCARHARGKTREEILAHERDDAERDAGSREW
jgi:hypothetical protein